MNGYRKFLQEFEQFRIRAGHLFDERVSAIPGAGLAVSGDWSPHVDVYETADRIVLTAEVAGVRRGDVSVEVMGNVLTLRGVRSADRSGAADETCLRLELPSGTFERSFELPCAVSAEGVEAVLGGGMLTVTLPRCDAASGRRIAVETG